MEELKQFMAIFNQDNDLIDSVVQYVTLVNWCLRIKKTFSSIERLNTEKVPQSMQHNTIYFLVQMKTLMVMELMTLFYIRKTPVMING